MAPPGIRSKRKQRELLPLLDVLRRVKPSQRVILLSHMSDATKDDIYATVADLLQGRRMPARKRRALKAKLLPFKDQLRFLADGTKSPSQKSKVLVQVGAGPMSVVLKTAVPLLLNLFRP